MAPAKPLQVWLDELVVAAPEDRRAVNIAGLEDGLAFKRVRCDRHKQTLNWLSAFKHLDRSEQSHRLHHGAGTRLHEPGDLRPLEANEKGALAPDSPWPVKRCGRSGCNAFIIWTTLTSGRRMPVDVEPVTDGPFVLTTAAGEDEPLAMQLYDDAPVGDVDRYVPHQRTCAARPRFPQARRGGPR